MLPALNVPRYYLSRKLGFAPPLPINYTLSVTRRCQSKCKTCGIPDMPRVDELSLSEWERVFASLGKSPYWVTLSGGEPFLRADLEDIVRSLVRICEPKIVNIPTNSLTPGTARRVSEMMLHIGGKATLVVNISVDHCRQSRNDVIRGVPGHYEKARRLYQDLKELPFENLSVGIHTVISKFNILDMQRITDQFMRLDPNHFITEIAEQRVELETTSADIQPEAWDYNRAINYLSTKMRDQKWSGLSRLTKAFRLVYYQLVKKWLATRCQPIPCFSGWASCQISEEGWVWPCCIKAIRLGNLREERYDFKKIWRSEEAGLTRQYIKIGACDCPLANASYTNMLHHPISLIKVLRNL